MEVELTARQVRIPKALREQAEEGMNRIARILGKTTTRPLRFAPRRHLQIAELTVKRGCRPLPPVARPIPRSRRCGPPWRTPNTRLCATATAIDPQTAAQGREGAGGAAGDPAQGARRPAGRRPKNGAGSAVKPQGAIDRGAFVSGARDRCGAAHRQKRRGYRHAAHDHGGGRQGSRVSRPRSARLSQSERATCLCSIAAATARWNWWRFLEHIY